MRRIARLLEKDLLKGPELGVSEQISVLAREYGFRVPVGSKAKHTEVPSFSLAASKSRLFWLYKTSNVILDVASDAFRHVEGKIFRFENDYWVDTQFRTGLEIEDVEFLSDRYFELLRSDPNLVNILPLGLIFGC